jgi:UDP-glucuronate 4-epimerase
VRAVVTGVAGFIGSHLAERLIADGWSVTGVDAFTPYYDAADKEANLAGLLTEPRFDLVRADVATFPLRYVFSDRPAVVHLAAQPGVRGSFGQGFEHYVHDNVLATQRVFEAARDTGCARVVYASSSSVYGDAPAFPVTESSPTLPRSPYGVTKRTCDHLGEVYRDLGLETVGMRYFTVYGPRQRPDMAIRRLCEATQGGPAFTLFGDGSQSRDFTHVDDAVDATTRAISSPDPGAVLNIGGGEEATMTRVISLLERASGQTVPVEMADAQQGDVRRTGADTTRARRRLGWAPQVGLVEGLASELDWVRARHGLPHLAAALRTAPFARLQARAS